MLFIIISLILLVVTVIGFFFSDEGDSFRIFVWSAFSLFIIFLFIDVFFLPYAYVEQISIYEEITQLKNNRKIYEKQANDILPQFKEILEEKYSKYEKDIYNKITIHNYQVYLAKYPELKNIESIKMLIDNINKYTNQIYETDIKIELNKKNIRENNQNPFIFVKKYNIE